MGPQQRARCSRAGPFHTLCIRHACAMRAHRTRPVRHAMAGPGRHRSRGQKCMHAHLEFVDQVFEERLLAAALAFQRASQDGAAGLRLSVRWEGRWGRWRRRWHGWWTELGSGAHAGWIGGIWRAEAHVNFPIGAWHGSIVSIAASAQTAAAHHMRIADRIDVPTVERDAQRSAARHAALNALFVTPKFVAPTGVEADVGAAGAAHCHRLGRWRRREVARLHFGEHQIGLCHADVSPDGDVRL